MIVLLALLALWHGTHDQSTHGSWARGRGGARDQRGRTMPRATTIRTPRRPRATGGGAQKPPANPAERLQREIAREVRRARRRRVVAAVALRKAVKKPTRATKFVAAVTSREAARFSRPRRRR